MRKIFSRRAAIENPLSADNRYGNGVQEIGEIFNEIPRLVVRILQNVNFTQLSCFEGVVQGLDHIFGNAALSDLEEQKSALAERERALNEAKEALEADLADGVHRDQCGTAGLL